MQKTPLHNGLRRENEVKQINSSIRTMIGCFVGREAAAIHGMKYALTQTIDVETFDIESLAETMKYQRDHGYKLAWIVTTMAEHKALWEAMTK